MRISEVAKKLGVHHSTIRRYIKIGELKAVLIQMGDKKNTNSWYITDEQLEDYLKKHNAN
jgi:excisionase family DNA binding protein